MKNNQVNQIKLNYYDMKDNKIVEKLNLMEKGLKYCFPCNPLLVSKMVKRIIKKL